MLSIQRTLPFTLPSVDCFQYIPLRPNILFSDLGISLSPAWTRTPFCSLHDLARGQDWVDLSTPPRGVSRPTLREVSSDLKKFREKIKLEDFSSVSSPSPFHQFVSHLSSSLALTWPNKRKTVHLAILSRSSIYDLAFSIVYSKYKVHFPFHHLGPYIADSVDFSPIWKAPYRSPSSKLDGDIAWRLLHYSLSSPHLSNKMDAGVSSSCPFCSERGTLIHMFTTCPSLRSLGKYMQKILHKISTDLTLDVKLFIFYLLPSRESFSQENRTLIDFILTLSKSVIYRTYMNYLNADSLTSPNYKFIFQQALRSRIRQDFHMNCTLKNNIAGFRSRWGPLGTTEEGTSFNLQFD